MSEKRILNTLINGENVSQQYSDLHTIQAIALFGSHLGSEYFKRELVLVLVFCRLY